ncbi:hypothetical protein HD554DRAFT_2177662 [Boletus coccyginus]|nr:hypothetical protein HD554DRAFT_2177662 [Boletus coccyginus]
MPLVNDGKYKIISVKYSPPSVEKKNEQVADLINGGPGPIAGRADAQVHNDQWYVKNKYHEPTSNSVTIENAEHRGNYAYAELVDGKPVLGQHSDPNQAVVWTLVARGDGKYNIQSPNNNLIWELKEPNHNIKLGDYGVGTQPYNEWRFQPA